MRIRRQIIAPLLVSIFAVAGSFLFSSTAHAAGTPCTSANQQDCQAVKATVLSKLTDKPDRACGAGAHLTNTTCGLDKAPAAGVTAGGEPYVKDDKVTCYQGPFDEYCSIAHTNGVTEYHDTGQNTSDDVIDNHGQFTGALGNPSPIASATKGTIGAVGDAASSFCDPSNPATQAACAVSAAATAGKAAVSAVQTAAHTIADVGSCVLSGPVNCLLQAVGSAILGVANFLLGIAGVLFNLIIVYGVFQFGNTIGNSPGVLTAWGILRDIANMALLFGFIFMGVATILDTGGVQQFTAKNALPKLIIFAVLMNFSLFACEAVIDISNALTSSMYQQANIDTAACWKAAAGATGTACGVNYGLAGHIMQTTGLSGIWAAGVPKLGMVQYLMLALFATIGAIVFFAAAIMLAIRLIVLTLLMIVSPIGFAGMAIPPLQKMAGDWWSRVLHQAFYAPIMLLLILISLKVADAFTSGTTHANNGIAGAVGNSSIGNVITDPNASTMSVVLVFMLVIGFMVASLVAANRFGAMGAAGAVNFGKKVVLGSYGKLGGIAGRNTIGRGGNWAQKKYEGFAGKNKAFRNFAMTTGLDDAIIAGTAAAKKAKFGGSASFEDKTKKDKERNKVLDETGRKAQFQKDLDAALNDTSITAQERDDKVANILDRMSVKELEELEVMKKSGDKLDQLVKNLSSEKFAALVKEEGKLSDAQKKQVRDSRFKEALETEANLASVMSNPNSTRQQRDTARSAHESRIRRHSVKDLENAPPDFLTRNANAGALNNTQRDELLKNGKLNTAAARKVREFDPVEQVNSAPSPTAAAQRVRSLRLNPKQVARLNSTVLQTAEMARIYTPKMLQAIQERNELDDATVRNIKRMIIQHGTPAAIAYMNSLAGAPYWI